MSTPSVRPRRIVTIVEGHGEVQALPVLLWRLHSELAPEVWLDLPRPFRVGRDSLLVERGIEDAVDAALSTAQDVEGLLVLFDSDDDCPATLGPALRERIERARPGLPTAVVLAHREYESWFLAAAPSLRGVQGMAADLDSPPRPEDIRGCKEWLTRHRPAGRPYKPMEHQPGLTMAFDIAMARANSPSFDKFCRDVAYLLTGKRGA
ncbi:DUF4276 family protein [Streptomyces sp. NPDC058620]|uniref:DUF4276 family protein n=1 Tax=Streptomyces sp. NPDC058620 TaxID=3346560 RepID=UPI0036696B50